MTLLEDEAQMRELLAPLSRVEPVTLPAKKGHRGHRVALIVGFLAAAFLATGAAIADVNPFTGIAAFVGIGAADHAQTSQDVLDPTAAALVQKFNDDLARAGLAQVLPDTARLVGQLPDGHNIYVLSTTTDDLGIVIDQIGADVAAPPSPSEPTTVATFDDVVNGPNATPPISWGIAKDGITAVSFMAGGSEQTVPVVNNVWAYEGENSALQSINVHYADGTTQTITH